ncbi:MAG TPA: hypothetical protein PLP25_02960 [Candidatus Limiplasma sp.]|nr:hypothetical protein [Candidatus Limiplasma sp.]HPS80808.1 hypothetical protein [Candidatus Limiplasma sp.]
MIIRELLTRFQAAKPNAYSQETLVSWISDLDGQISQSVHQGRAGMPTLSKAYSVDTDLNTVLLVPFPFEQIYLFWLSAMVDNQNEEYDRYANEMQLFNSYKNSYAASVAQSHADLNSGWITV